MKGKIRDLIIDTRPSKEVVVEGLTRDATIEACICDLIDNSIDAARGRAVATKRGGDGAALLSSYKGYTIQIDVNADRFRIEDNCGGILLDRLQESALRFGKRSGQNFGIGVFGVGLNRAIFKLGKITNITSDDGVRRTTTHIDVDQYLASDNWNISAKSLPTLSAMGTVIEISKLSDMFTHQASDSDWIEQLRVELSRRYARFLEKGLNIKVNKVSIKAKEVLLRQGGPYDGDYKYYKTSNGVSVHIRFGQHQEHRFKSEADYNADANKALTKEYGWTVLCNERAILISDTSNKTGWVGKFHSEFYGFVGFVSFECVDPAKLPWNTTKTDIDLNSPIYRLALDDMAKFTAKWRSFAGKRKKAGGVNPLPPRTKAKTSKTQKGGLAAGIAKNPTVYKKNHNQFRTVLPDDVNELHCNDKHLTLVHEAKTLDLGDFSYSGLALVRMLFESSAIIYFIRHDKIEEVKQFSCDRREKKGKKISDAEKKKLLPTIEEMLAYMENNPNVWGAKQSYLKHSLQKMAAHQPFLNGVLHNPFQSFHNSKAFEIRDEVLPLLRHLIET